MDYALPITLLVISLGLVVLEVFIPSFGLLTIMSIASLIAALVLGFEESTTFGWSLVGVAVAGIPTVLFMAFRVFPSTPLGKHMILSGPGRHPEPATRDTDDSLVGREGIAKSQLRPSGTAEIDDQRVDVITRGELLEAGARIRVIESSGNRIVVRRVEEPSSKSEEEKLR